MSAGGSQFITACNTTGWNINIYQSSGCTNLVQQKIYVATTGCYLSDNGNGLYFKAYVAPPTFASTAQTRETGNNPGGMSSRKGANALAASALAGATAVLAMY